MALETLKDLVLPKGVEIDHEENSIKFTIQNGAIKENGVNGCQVDFIITVAFWIIKGLNKKFPCRENSIAITKLEEASHWLNQRTIDREKRKVEGTEAL